MVYQLLNIITDVTPTVKWISLTVISFVTGTTFAEGIMVFFFQGAESAGFFDSGWFPAFLGGVGGLLVVIIGQISSHILSLRAEKAKDQRRIQEQNNLQHVTFTDKIAELQQERDEKFLEELKNFHDDKVEFKNAIIKDLKVSDYAARQREHLALNEVHRLWSHINLCHAKMKIANIEYPELAYKSQEDIMDGLEERIVKYAQSLEPTVE